MEELRKKGEEKSI